MKLFTFLIVLGLTPPGFAQDTLRLEMQQYEPNEEIFKYLSKPSGTLLLTCQSYDKELLSKINDFRNLHNLKSLATDTGRLDSLGKKEVYYMHFNGVMAHYTALMQMQRYKDLMGYENIASHIQAGNTKLLKTFNQNSSAVLDWWIHSPGHLKNLLVSDDNAKIASVASMIVITFENGFYKMVAYYAYEADDVKSLREKNVNTSHAWTPPKSFKKK